MVKNFTRVLYGIMLIACINITQAYGQQIQNLADNYYYNNFNGGAVGSAFTQVNGASLAISAAGTDNLTPASGYSLSSQAVTTANSGFRLSFVNSGTNMDNEQYGWEWTFLYKNTFATALGNPANSDVVGGTIENSWKYWLYASTNNLTTTTGYFITQVDDKLYLRFQYDSDPTHYHELQNYTLPSNNTTYAIRVQRLKRSGQFVWHLFVDTYSASQTTATTERGNTNGAYHSTYGTYQNSALLVSSTSSGRFLFDEMKMYSMKLEIAGANESSNGISNPLYKGQVNAIIYGLELKTRGYFDIYQMKFSLTGNITSIIDANTVYLKKSTDNFFGSPDDVSIAQMNCYNEAVQNYNMSDKFFTIGNDDGSTKIAGYYFLTANVRSDANISSTFTFTGAPELISQSAQVNYVSNGSVVQTAAEPSSSGQVYDWQGTTDTDWSKASNWSPNTGVPGLKDVARIGVISYPTNHPVVSGTTNVGNIIIGTAKANPSLTVNGTISVLGSVTQMNAENSDFTTTIAGSGTMLAANFLVGNRTTLTGSSTRKTTVTNTLANVTISNALILNGMSTGSAVNNALISVDAGDILTVKEVKSINGVAGNISALVLNSGATLKLTGATAFSNFSETGGTYIITNTTSPATGLSTIEYAGATAQTLYTSNIFFGAGAATAVPTIAGYSSIAFSGAGTKTAATGTLLVRHGWNSAGGKIDLLTNSTIVTFNGTTAAQALTDAGSDGGNGVFFKDVNFNGGASAPKTMSGAGRFSVAVGGNINVTGNTILNAGGVLYLKSSALGFANVGQLTGTSSINGNTNVEVFISGVGNGGIRGTRMMTSPVNDSAAPKTFYNYLKDYIPVTGPGNTANGFDLGGITSPNAVTLNIYNEPALLNASQYIAVPSITNSKFATLPGIGKGVMVFFRGARTNLSSKLNAPFSDAESVTTMFTGPINKGAIAAPITHSNNPGDTYNGYNVMGNPYPATISWDAVYASNTFVSRTIMILKPNGGMMTRSWISGSNYAVTNPTGPEDAAGLIQPGQGFYIKKNAAADGNNNLNFAESHKAAAGVTAGRYLSAPVKDQLFASIEMGLLPSLSMGVTGLTEPIVLYINLKDATNKDETAIVFREGNSAGFDGDDAPYLAGSTVQLSSLSSEGVATAINFMPAINTVGEVKLSINANTSGPVSLNFTNISALGRYNAILKDNFLNTTTDIKANPTYSFEIDKTNAATYGTGRFVIVFQEPAAIQIVLSDFVAAQQGTGVQLDWKTTTEVGSSRFEIEHSVTGQAFTKLGQLAAAGTSSATLPYTYTHATPADGLNYYRLKEIFTDGSTAYSVTKTVNYNAAFNVVMSSFTVEKQNSSSVLSWSTSSEAGSDYFNVERSQDGINYVKIGSRPAAGTSGSTKAYLFDDGSPELGINYYRLKAVFTDGSSSYSAVKSVIFSVPSVIQLSGFTAAQLGAAIKLNWATATETGSSRFEIERSTDGTNYEYLSQQLASGTSVTEKTYSYLDVNPVVGAASYRIKMITDDNNFTYSSSVSISYAVPLSISLASFTSDQVNEKVVIDWVTTKENGSAKFEVERSVDGNTFIKLNETAAAGISTITKTYSTADASPLAGTSYYRLKITYTDGTFSYSAVNTTIYTKPLSIVLSSFTATQVNKAISLNWATSSEEGGAKFEVERSADGITFTKLGEVAASGNSSATKNYAYADGTPLVGSNYYRLKQIYTDGSFTYSAVKNVTYIKPIKLDFSAFTATRKSAKIALAWTSASEENTKRFEVERSADGTTFTKIGEVGAAGNSSVAKMYTFDDASPLQGMSYYRIKQVNNDGQSAYSDVRSIEFKALAPLVAGTITVFPNPATEKIEVNVGGAAATLSIYNLTGKKVKSATFAQGEPVVSIVSELNPGLYIVEVRDPQTNKLVGSAKFFKN